MSKAKIISDPRILGGKPVIKGTRISVELIMNFLSAGMNIDEITDMYPELKKYEVQAAVDYAKGLVTASHKSKSKQLSPQISVAAHEIIG